MSNNHYIVLWTCGIELCSHIDALENKNKLYILFSVQNRKTKHKILGKIGIYKWFYLKKKINICLSLWKNTVSYSNFILKLRKLF